MQSEQSSTVFSYTINYLKTSVLLHRTTGGAIRTDWIVIKISPDARIDVPIIEVV